MIRVLVVLTLAMLGGGAALAQESRLDAIQKAGALRVCTPGDYKPFSLARPDGTYEGMDQTIGPSGACGYNKWLAVRMPLKLTPVA